MQRLKTRAQFEAVMGGATVSRTAHFALHRANLPTGPGSDDGRQALFAVNRLSGPEPWMGAVVPKRWAKRAVTRNTVKRQIYAVSEQFHESLQPVPFVVRLRSAFDRKEFVSATSEALKKAVRAELLELFGKVAAKAAPAAAGKPA
ncbi:MAG: ribonuclease P protein component [Burkholderiaceae bacterium]